MRKRTVYLITSTLLCAGGLLADPFQSLRDSARGNVAAAIYAFFPSCDLLHSLAFDPWSPLHEAAYVNAVAAAEALLDLGLDVEAEDGNGYTPLYVARNRQHAAMQTLLIFRGATR